MGGKSAAAWAVLVVIFGCGCGGRIVEGTTASAGSAGAIEDIILGGAPSVASSAPAASSNLGGGSTSSAGQPSEAMPALDGGPEPYCGGLAPSGCSFTPHLGEDQPADEIWGTLDNWEQLAPACMANTCDQAMITVDNAGCLNAPPQAYPSDYAACLYRALGQFRWPCADDQRVRFRAPCLPK